MLISDPGGENVESPALSFRLSRFGPRVAADASLKPIQVVEAVPRETPEYAVRGRIVWLGKGGDQGGSENPVLVTPVSADVRLLRMTEPAHLQSRPLLSKKRP
jgi:hypothetical protein